MQKIGYWLIFFGLSIVVLGVVVTIFPRYGWLGSLPGDIKIRWNHIVFHFPIVTCLILSVFLTLIVNFFRKLF